MMNEAEQDGLLEGAKRLLKEAVGAFFDGNIDRAAGMAHAAYVLAELAQDANPTREGIRAVYRLYHISRALERFVLTEERDA